MAKLTEELQACLPQQGPLADYMHWAHRLTHAPPMIHLACSLPIVSYELVRRGFTLPIYDTLTLWLGVIAPPASAKTTCLKWAREFSRDFYQGIYGADLAPKPWVSLEGSLPGVLHAISEREDDKLPIIPGILHHTEASKVFFHEEAPATLCQLYDGEDIDRNYRYLQKAKAEGDTIPLTIKAPRLSAVFMTTHAALDRVAKREMLEGGLFSRLLWMEEQIDALQPWPLKDDIGRRWLLDRWKIWSRTIDGLQTGHALQPEIGFDEQALAFLGETLFEKLGPSMRQGSMEASVSLRVMPHAARVAACFAASRLSVVREAHPETGAPRARIVIELDDIVRAANFVFRAFKSAMEIGGKSAIQSAPVETRRELLLQQIKKAGRAGLARREAYKVFRSAISKRALDDLVAELIDADEVGEVILPSGRLGGRPSKRLIDIAHFDDVVQIVKGGGSTTTQ